MKFDWCETNLNIGCGEYKYDHCEMCNIARAYQHGYEIAKEDTPTIDVVEVVRCQDCLMTKERDEYTNNVWCCRHREYMDEMYYCADGLRREDGEA